MVDLLSSENLTIQSGTFLHVKHEIFILREIQSILIIVVFVIVLHIWSKLIIELEKLRPHVWIPGHVIGQWRIRHLTWFEVRKLLHHLIHVEVLELFRRHRHLVHHRERRQIQQSLVHMVRQLMGMQV